MSAPAAVDAPPQVLAEPESGGRTVRVLCPFCRGPRGGRRWHVHGIAGGYGLRLSHCHGQPAQTYLLVPAPEGIG